MNASPPFEAIGAASRAIVERRAGAGLCGTWRTTHGGFGRSSPSPERRSSSRKTMARIRSFAPNGGTSPPISKDADGASYGVQWTLFRFAMRRTRRAPGWDDRNLWMGHAAATSAGEHLFAQKFARGGIGQAGVEAAPFRAYIDDWRSRDARR